MTNRDDIPPRIARHIRLVRDALEQAGRVPGERVELTRQEYDQAIDDLHVVDRLNREMAERST
jgi:hypothetical protein